MRSASFRLVFLVALLVPVLGGLARGQQAPLPMGTAADGRVSSGGAAVYEVDVDHAGILAVQVHTTGDADLYLTVVDSAGQPLPDGRADIDAAGNLGTESISVVIRRPGRYTVRVETHGQGADFQVIGSWLSAPDLELPPDPDGLPTGASALQAGEPHEDSLDPGEGDAVDWYAIRLEAGGMVTVVVEAADGDLALELYRGGDYATTDQRSDQDLEGNAGHESLTFRLAADELAHVKVVPVFSGASRIDYTIRMGVM